MRAFDNYPGSQLIGLSGTFCAGKDTAAEHLVAKHGFMHVSTGDVLRKEATRQGRDHQRPTLIEIGVGLRDDYGSLGALVIRAREQWQGNRDRFAGGLVVSGIRIVGEAQEFKGHRSKLVFVDGPVGTRYERQRRRALDEGRTIDTANTLEEFIESEIAESEGSGGPERPNLGAIRGMADIRIWNDSSKEAYLYDLEQALGLANWAVGE